MRETAVLALGAPGSCRPPPLLPPSSRERGCCNADECCDAEEKHLVDSSNEE